MNKVYNIENEIAISLSDFFKKIDFKLSKPQKKIIPHILSSIILAENITTSDLSKVFIDDSFLSNDASIQKKLWRFFNNPKFNGNNFFHHCIKNVINNLKCIKNSKLVVIFDHMYITVK